MKPLTANYLNAFILIAAGLYGYFMLETKSVTALIPSFAGVLFIITGLIWSKSPKAGAHIAAVLALVLIIMLWMRFPKADVWDAKQYVFLICIISNILALIIFIRSFMVARVIKKNP